MGQRKKTDASTEAKITEKWQIVSDESEVKALVDAQQTQATAEVTGQSIPEEEKVAVVEYEDDPTGTPEVGSVVQFKINTRRSQIGNLVNKHLFNVGDYAKIKRGSTIAWFLTIGSVEDSPVVYHIPKSWMGEKVVLQKIKE